MHLLTGLLTLGFDGLALCYCDTSAAGLSVYHTPWLIKVKNNTASVCGVISMNITAAHEYSSMLNSNGLRIITEKFIFVYQYTVIPILNGEK
jgi:hypothetical protein